MADNTPLSPAAKAVLDAYRSFWLDEPMHTDEECLASALRAAALHIDDGSDGLESQDILRQIAAELEGFNG